MKCNKCGKPIKMKWIKLAEGKERLVVICGCKKEKEKHSFAYHRFREPTAFGYDKKTGKPVAIDKKGRRFDPKDTRYNFKKDPHGWKAVGIKK